MGVRACPRVSGRLKGRPQEWITKALPEREGRRRRTLIVTARRPGDVPIRSDLPYCLRRQCREAPGAHRQFDGPMNKPAGAPVQPNQNSPSNRTGTPACARGTRPLNSPHTANNAYISESVTFPARMTSSPEPPTKVFANPLPISMSLPAPPVMVMPEMPDAICNASM